MTTMLADPPIPPAMTPPRWTRRLRFAVPVGAALACGLAFAGGAVVGVGARSHTVAPVHVTVPPALPPSIVVAPAPPAPPPAVVEAPAPPAPPPALRATVPHFISAECMFVDEYPRPAGCDWDEGFPAISADGKLIATGGYGIEDPSGLPSASLHLLDAATGRTVRSTVILSADEYALAQDPEARAKLIAQVQTRADAAQRTLDARRFRTLLLLGSLHAPRTPDPEAAGAAAVYAEFSGELVRIIDPATRTVIGQHRFAVPRPRRVEMDVYDECGGWNLADITAWWDPATRQVLGATTYHTGGCMCPSSGGLQVYRMP